MQVINALAARHGGFFSAGRNPVGRGRCGIVSFPVA